MGGNVKTHMTERAFTVTERWNARKEEERGAEQREGEREASTFPLIKRKWSQVTISWSENV